METSYLNQTRFEKIPKMAPNIYKTSSLIQLSKGNETAAKFGGDYSKAERKDVAYQDKTGIYYDPNHSEFYGVPNSNPTAGKLPITNARLYELPKMHRPRPGIVAPRNPNDGTNNFRSIYLPKPMPPEMKPLQNQDWLYTRKRKYARPLLYEPLERAKRAIPLAGKLATTSLSRYDRYQLPENNLPQNPEYSATIAPNAAFASTIQANITRGKKYTHAPLNQRYLYNNITDTEKKIYDEELQAAITMNEGARSEQFYKTPLAGSVPGTIQNQLPTTSRNYSSHLPLNTQMQTATKTRSRNGASQFHTPRVVRSYQEVPGTQNFYSKIESRRGDEHLHTSKLNDFDDPQKYSIKF